MEVKTTYLGTMIGLATVAFGLIAAGAWNQFIKDLIGLFLKSGSGIWAEFIYALLVTVLAIAVVQGLTKLEVKEQELRAKLPFSKRTPE